MTQRALKREMSWAVLGQVVYLVSQFGVLAALTRFGTLADVGRFGLAMAISTPVVTFSNLGLRIALATDAEGEYKAIEYFRLRIVSSFIALPAMIVASWIAAPEGAATLMTTLIALSKIAESQSDIYYGSFQQRQRMDLVARSLMLRGPATTIGFTMILWQTGSPAIAFSSQVVFWTAVALLHDRPIAYSLSSATPIGWDRDRMWRLARQTMPLGVATTMARLSGSAPRLAIGGILGLEALGLFTAIAYVWQAGMIALQQATNSLAAPLSQAWHKDNRQRFRSVMNRYAVLFAAVFLAAAALALPLGDYALRLAFGPKYHGGGLLLSMMLVVLALQSAAVVYQMGIFSQRQFGIFAWNRTMLVAASAGFSAAGAMLGGLDGVGLGLIAFSIIQLVAALAILARGYRIRDKEMAPSPL